MAIIIFAFYRSFRKRLWPHIGIKIDKDLPTFTYRNASSPIDMIFPIIGVLTSPTHRLPDMILRCACHSMFACSITIKTSTRK